MRALCDEIPGPAWVGRSLRGSRTVLCARRRTLVYPDEDTVFAGVGRGPINSLSRRFAWRPASPVGLPTSGGRLPRQRCRRSGRANARLLDLITEVAASLPQPSAPISLTASPRFRSGG